MTIPRADLLIRADAGEDIGSGHLMRCLALAQAAQDLGWRVVLAAHPLPPALRQRLEQEDVAFHELQSGDEMSQTIRLADQAGVRWVVLDGYQFGAKDQRVIRDAGLRLLVIDDYGQAEAYCADLILNQNLHATAALYGPRATTSRLLLGTRYALLRREFRVARQRREIPGRARRVLVTFGGADTPNVTSRALEALDGLDVETQAVIGPANPHAVAVECRAAIQPASVRVRRNPPDLPQVMHWADLAISAAGSTCWELAFMGVPQLLVVLAENQRLAAERLEFEQIARNLGWHDAVTAHSIRTAVMGLIHDRDTRAAMSALGERLVDGAGADRVVLEMKSCELTFRPVQEAESRLIFEWANDTGTRAASFSSEPIAWEHHARWFPAKLKDPCCHFWMVCDEAGERLGQVRFDIAHREAVISISLAAAQRGRGLGSAVILGACRQLLARSAAESITAFVKPENMTSSQAFLRAGFIRGGDTQIKGQRAEHFSLRRSER